MKLGLLTAPFPETPLLEVADWAASEGFEALEIACWPRSSGPTRRIARTSHIDVANLPASKAKEIVAALAEMEIAISALGYYPNRLHADLVHRKAVIDHLKRLIVAAGRMGVSVVNTFCGGDASKTVDANWRDALKVWPKSSPSRATTG